MATPRGGRSVRILLSTAGLALVLTSCGGGDNNPADPTPVAASERGTTGDSSSREDNSPLNLVDAAAVAVKAVDDSSLLSIETELNRTIWEATVVTGDGTEHEMLIGKSDGSLIDGPTKKEDDAEDKADNRTLVGSAELSYRESARASSDPVPDARLTELNVDTFDDRITSWEGDLYGDDGIRYRVTIDARSGKVLDADAEDDD